MARSRLDHLVMGVADLPSAVFRIQEEWGCSVLQGGRHPRWGTWNALVPLVGGAYLEIVALDSSAAAPEGPRVFGLDDLAGDGLVTWALRPERREGTGPVAEGVPAGGPGEGGPGSGEDPLEELAAEMTAEGVPPGAILPGERRTPAGHVLRWRLTDPAAVRLGGAAPFLIDWGDTPHPGDAATPEVSMTSLRLAHPDPEALRGVLGALGFDDPRVALGLGPTPALSAEFETPKGNRRMGPAGPHTPSAQP